MVKHLFSIFLTVVTCLTVYAQPGKNGNFTVPAANTVVNTYSRITANVTAGSTAVTVNSIAGELGGLAAGDLIMIYQAQGAAIQATDDNNYGAILAYNSSGLYEYAYVASISGNTITISCTTKHAYSATGRAQVIKVPQYANLTIPSGTSLVPTKWTGTVGGIVAVHVSGVLTNNGTLSAESAGFRGGKRDNLSSTADASVVVTYRTPTANFGGEKGEGIAGYQADYDVAGMGGRYGRGAPANGGGGGNGHNAAGGGGANGNNGRPWTGAGVMDPNPVYLPAWQFDPDFISNGNALTNSSGGGRGGYTYGSVNANAFVNGPGDAAWGGDQRDPVGGRGGRPLASLVESRIFFGGGGGAGDGNNNASNDGGDGGGIVYVIANTIVGTGIISSQGQNGYNTVPNHNDAPGGGGGGGTIIVKAFSFTGQTLNANGGSGGNQLLVVDESEGCAGGGGGGFIGIPTSGSGSCGLTNTYNYVFGVNGTSTSNSATEFPPNGGTLGATGQNDVPVSPYFIPYTLSCIIDGDLDLIHDPTTDLDDDNDGIADIIESFSGIDPSADSDSDNIPNYADPSFAPYLDANCDGINDYFDFDLDAIPDFLDLDSDNDGITDCTEAGGNDSNRDGIVDGFVDADLNGMSDPLGAGLAPGDMDLDTRYSFRDRDSDGDGITDCIEGGGTDANKDGIIDGFTDTDKDGYANTVDPTTNRSALSGANASGSTPLAIPDTDGDSKRNFLDIDSDNDGITDNVEAQNTAGYVAPVNADTDGDGIANLYDITPLILVNTDGADAPDYLDSDSDNDGVPDSIEGNDSDSDGVPTPALPVTGDADGDGLLDGYDLLPGANSTVAGMSGTGSSAPLQNSDGDLLRDWRDTDDDGDCVATSSTGPSGENTNSNASWADDFSQGGVPKPNYLFASNLLTVTNADRCGNGSVALNASASSTGIFRWYNAPAAGTLLQTTAAATSSIYNTPSLSVNTTYYVEFDNGCVTARKPVIATIITTATTPVVAAASRCDTGTLTLGASSGSSGTFRWYSAASGGTLLLTTVAATVSNYTTPSIATTTTYYVEFDNGTCTSGRASVAGTIGTPPAITITNGSTCGNPTTTLAASASVSGTFNWYDSPTGGLLLFSQAGVSASSFTTPSIAVNTTYYVEYSNGSCTSTRSAATATVTSAITSPTITNSTICTTGTTTVSASYGVAGTFRWYSAVTGGTLLKTDNSVTSSSYTTPSISSSTDYFVEYSNATCTTMRTKVSAYVVSTSVTGINASRCGAGVLTVGATSALAGTFTWYAAASGGSPLLTSAANTTSSSYTTPSIGSTVIYYVSFSTSSPACGPTTPRVAVTATIGSAATITPTNGGACAAGTVLLSASTGVSGTFRWYATSTGGALLSSTVAATSSNFTTPVIGATADYYVEFDNGSCVTLRTPVRASIIGSTDLTTTDVNRCGTGNVDLLVSSLTPGTFNFYDAASGGTLLNSSGANATTHTYTRSVSATTTFYVSVTTASPACTGARYPIVATVYPAATAPAAITGSRCGTGTVTIAASSSTAGTISWYTASSGGTLLQTDNTTTLSTYITPSISATTTYYAEFSNGVCGSSARTAITATVNAGSAPTAPAATGASRCGSGSLSLTATSGSAGVFRWWSALTGGTLLQTTPAATTSTYNTPSLAATTNYYVEFDNGTCVSSARATVAATINTIPLQPTAPDVARCGNGTVMLTATSGTSGTFRWYSAPTGGTLLLTTLTSSTSAYTTTAIAATTTYYVEFDNGACTSVRTAVDAIINSTPTVPTGVNGSHCGTGSVSLSATSLSNGTFRWYDAAVGGSLLSTSLSTSSSSFSTPSISSNTTYYVEFDNGTCLSTRATVTATILGTPTIPTVASGERCGSGTVNLSASSASSGTFRWYTASTGGTLLETDVATTSSSFTTTSLSSSLVYYVEFDNGTCPSNRVAVMATINPVPVISNVTVGCTGIAGNGTIAITASISAGTLEYSVNGSTYQPSNAFTGLANNTYTVYVRETSSLCVVSQGSVVVQCNVPPTVSNKTATINEDNALSGDLTDGGDSDTEGTVLTVNTTPVVAPTNGGIVLNSNGTYTYTPNAAFHGTETITFQVCDNGSPLPAACVNRTLTITVNDVNDEPSFVKGGNQTINEDAAAQNIAGWATVISKGPANESTQTLNFAVSNDNNALFSVQPAINATTGNLTYTPAAHAFGSATVSIVLTDNGGTANGGDDTFATQTFTITVNAVNDEPSFVKGANQSINEDAAAQNIAGWATVISKGPANESTQTLNFAVSNDNNAMFSVQPAINATTGNLTYTPAANASGFATVSVILTDNGGTANGGDDTFTTQTFTITVNDVNDEPSFVKGANQTINEDATAQNIAAWATAISKGPANESTQTLNFAVSNDNNALFSVQPAINATTGNLTYTPAANAFGSATVSVILTDNGGTANGGDDTFTTQTFTITVNDVNDEPSFVKGANQSINEDAAAQNIAGWATVISKGPANEGTQTLNFAVSNDNNAMFSVQPAINATTGNLTYTPVANAFGSATVSIILTDNGGTANGGDDTFTTQAFTITVNDVNDEPSFVKGANQTINEDAAAQNIAGWATAITKGPANESTQTLNFAVSNDNNALFSVQPAINATTGNLTYTPAANAFGSATVSIILTDNGGTANGGDDTFTTQTFTIAVSDVNDEPSFVKGANQTINEDAAAQNIAGWATAITKGPANESTQTLNFAVSNDNNTLFSIQPAINATTGNLTYTPAANAFGSATVSVILTDNGGTANGGDDTFTTQAFTITINDVNDEPSFVKGANQSINEDAAAQNIAGWATAISKGPANESTQTLNFALANDNNALFSVQPAINATTGNLTYTPAAHAFGSATVSIILADNGGTANGGDDTFTTQTFTITVNDVNDEPSFVKGANQSINEDAAAQNIAGWATVISKGPANESTQTLNFAVSNDNNALFSIQPAINATTGNLTYTPAANAFGSATVSVILTDNGGTANGGDDTFTTQTFMITINAVNDEPSFVKGANQTINEDAAAQNIAGWATAITKGPANESTQTLNFAVSNDNNALFSVQPAINATTGNLTYTPTAHAFGTTTVSVILTDNGGTANGGDDTFTTQTFTITVNDVNDEPSFVKGANQTINEDATAQNIAGWATVISKGPANESTQTLNFAVSNDNNALFSVQPSINATTGNLTYTPAANAFGSATVSIILTDNGGTANGGDDTFTTQTFTITINAVNDEPSFVKGANQTINEDAAAQNIAAWATAITKGPANESSQTLNFALSNDNNALFSVQPSINATTGNLTYTPAANAFGSATVSIVLTDNGGTANGGDDTFTTQTFTISMSDVNDEPSFVKGANQTINEDAAAQNIAGWATAISKGPANEITQTLNFALSNDNNALFSAQPAINAATGNLTYTPVANAFGSATVSIILTDNGGTANGGDDTFTTQTFTITVNGVNDEPSFVKGANQTVNEDAPSQTIAGWATVISRGPANESMQTLNFAVSNDNNALFSVQPTINATTGNLTYIPAANAFGSATVSIILTDNGGTANGGDDTFTTQTFTISIIDVNDEPSFVKGTNQTVNEDAVAQNIAAWATAINKGQINESAQVLTFNMTNDNNALFSVQPAINATTGDLTYTLALNAFGVATISVTLSDDGGTANGGDNSFATQTFSITVTSVNDAPIFVKGADQSVNEDAGAQTLSAWATSISAGAPNENTQLMVFSVSNNNNAIFSAQPSIDPSTGDLIYTPAPNAFGSATVTVALADDGGTANGGVNTSPTQTFTITINTINDAPVAGPDSPATNEDTPLTFNVTLNDVDVDGTIDAASVDLDQTIAGIQSSVTDSQGTWTVDGSGDVSFNPLLNFNGIASISYTVNDNSGTPSAPAAISITVAPVNDPAVIVNDNAVAVEDATITFNVTSNDTDVDGTVDPTTVDLDIATVGIQHIFTNSQGSWAANTAGDVTFTPVPNFNGTATLNYTVNDNDGATSLPGTISVSVDVLNDAPVAVADIFAVDEDTSAPFNVTTNDFDIDGTIDASSIDIDPATAGVQKTLSTTQGNWIVDIAGNITFTPALHFNGLVSIDYVVKDNDGGVSNAITFSLTINPVNDAPVMNDDAIVATQNLDVTGNILTAADYDPDGSPLTVNTTPVSGPNHGALVMNPNGSFSYTSSPGFVGTDIIVITVCDSGLPLPAACSNTTLTVTVVLNQRPTISTKRASVDEDFALAGNVLNTSDFDPEGLPLVVNTVPADLPQYGTVTINPNGSYLYTPAGNFNGRDTFSIQICDTNPIPACTTMDVIVTVNPENDAPILLPDIGPGERNEIATGFILLGDLDPDSTQLTVTTVPVVAPSHGSIVIESNGNYTYTPDRNYIGEDEITIEVCDNGSPLPRRCVTSTLTMRITDPLAGVVFVPEGFSPNDDGANDRFEIVYTGSDPIHLEIYNRWGNLVYAQENYQNDWDGVATRGLVVGSQLPDGTYFYKVSIGNYKQVKSFTLQR